MPDFDDALRSLAGHAQRTGRLDPAAAIRKRADRRRRGRYTAAGTLGLALLGALAVGIAVARPDALPPHPPAVLPSTPQVMPSSPVATTPASPPLTSTTPSHSPSSTAPKSSPPSTSSKSATPTRTSGGVLAGNRQVWILPEVSEGPITVDSSMNAGVSDDFGDRALFVFTPSAGRYQIKTAKLRVDNDPANETYCLAVKNGKVVATACDAADSNQLFFVLKSGTNSSDKATYVIRTKDHVFLRVADMMANLTASKIEEGTAGDGTDFLLPDKGEASLPALD